MTVLRVGLVTLSVCLCFQGRLAAQPDILDRSNLIYVMGTVTRVLPESAIIDLGEAHTLRELETLAVFRPAGSYFEAVGLATVRRALVTSSQCTSPVALQENDLVMTVRELSQLRPGRQHRARVLSRQVLRIADRDSRTTVRNLNIAQALLDYELQYPDWERSQADVAGSLMSGRMRSGRTQREDRLVSQIDLLRQFYRRSTRTVPAAGRAWEQAMGVLAGDTARAENAVIRETAETDEPAAFTPQDVRARVIEEIFDRRREQQNAIAIVVAALTERDSDTTSEIILTTSLRRTQFPELADDEQLLEDMRAIARELEETQ